MYLRTIETIDLVKIRRLAVISFLAPDKKKLKSELYLLNLFSKKHFKLQITQGKKKFKIFWKISRFWVKIPTKLELFVVSKTPRVPFGHHSRGRAGSGLSRIVGFGLRSI